MNLAEFPTAVGTYTLLLKLNSPTRLQIGRLGCFDFPAGYYGYIGSAYGPGGLRARLRHHLQPALKPHWHIDFFRLTASVFEVGFRLGTPSMECEWSRQVAGLNQTTIPVPGIGASDCRQGCAAHLYHLGMEPDLHQEKFVGAVFVKIE